MNFIAIISIVIMMGFLIVASGIAVIKNPNIIKSAIAFAIEMQNIKN